MITPGRGRSLTHWLSSVCGLHVHVAPLVSCLPRDLKVQSHRTTPSPLRNRTPHCTRVKSSQACAGGFECSRVRGRAWGVALGGWQGWRHCVAAGPNPASGDDI
jgi:hypothetical protein